MMGTIGHAAGEGRILGKDVITTPERVLCEMFGFLSMMNKLSGSFMDDTKMNVKLPAVYD